MRVKLPSAIRRGAPVLGILLLASLTALPASAQHGPAYYPPTPYGGMYAGPGYPASNQFLNNVSYYMYQNNPQRYGNYTIGDTDFGYATIPPAVNPDSTADTSDQPNDGRTYIYNYTGGAGPVYDNPDGTEDTYCFPC